MINRVLRLVLYKLHMKGVTEVLNTRREKKDFCLPTHLTEAEALHVAKQADEREWSNSAYIRHLVKKDIERCLTDSYLSGESVTHSIEHIGFSVRNKQNEQAKKSPSAVTDEPDRS